MGALSWRRLGEAPSHGLVSLRSVNTVHCHLSVAFHALGMSRETRTCLLGGGDGLSVPPKWFQLCLGPAPFYPV